ncbi:hypothetical protein NC653_010447 [Populus alba x Populus x berolinensis]|uniref:Uncharacterized protein n=1 Tax=Populus alba x Populus x berolinensis TaxID=444605 RepID=A0AAD6W586_9ROSI|nr:hypothetical protein NC653_010447 [Populus alba x Populus x berolinensis]
MECFNGMMLETAELDKLSGIVKRSKAVLHAADEQAQRSNQDRTSLCIVGGWVITHKVKALRERLDDINGDSEQFHLEVRDEEKVSLNMAREQISSEPGSMAEREDDVWDDKNGKTVKNGDVILFRKQTFLNGYATIPSAEMVRRLEFEELVRQMAKFTGELFVLNVDCFCLALASKKIHATSTMGILLTSEPQNWRSSILLLLMTTFRNNGA